MTGGLAIGALARVELHLVDSAEPGAAELAGLREVVLPDVRDGDVVVIHDPQPAGMIPAIKELGLPVIWRCHIGRDQPNELTAKAWEFLHPYISLADRVVVSRQAHIPPGIPEKAVSIVQPCIDPFAPKNADISDVDVHRVLVRIGVLDAPDDDQPIHFPRLDQSIASLSDDLKATLIGDKLPVGAPVVVQVSRWDRLKDMIGVLRGFLDADLPEAAHVALHHGARPHFLAGLRVARVQPADHAELSPEEPCTSSTLPVF